MSVQIWSDVSELCNMSDIDFFLTHAQISLIVAVNVIGQRMDFYALLHSCALLAVLSRRRRKAIGEVWPKYCCFTAGLMVLQYVLCIGIPPAFCAGMKDLMSVWFLYKLLFISSSDKKYSFALKNWWGTAKQENIYVIDIIDMCQILLNKQSKNITDVHTHMKENSRWTPSDHCRAATSNYLHYQIILLTFNLLLIIT